MHTTSVYPVLMTDRVAATAAFYQDHFGFQPMFSADWYVHLQSATDPSVNLAILDGSHATIPEVGRGRVSGVILNFGWRTSMRSMPDLPRPACRFCFRCAMRISGSVTSSRPIRMAS